MDDPMDNPKDVTVLTERGSIRFAQATTWVFEDGGLGVHEEKDGRTVVSGVFAPGAWKAVYYTNMVTPTS